MQRWAWPTQRAATFLPPGRYSVLARYARDDDRVPFSEETFRTTPRQVEVTLGEPLTLQLVDPGPGHVLTGIYCGTWEGIDAERTFGDLDL